MIKNPKKNYSLKGKPLSTKIAFVVICILIFSLILGSFGGLIYLSRSCSNITTVSAAGVGGTEETVVESEISLNVSGIDFTATNVRTADGQLCDFDEFMFYLPLTIRTRVTNRGSSVTQLDTNYFDANNNVETDPFVIDTGVQAEGDKYYFNYGCFAYKLGAVHNVGLVLEVMQTQFSPNFGYFGQIATCEFQFAPSVYTAAVLSITLTDVYGGYFLFHIYPLNNGEPISLGNISHFSARYVYQLNPFNEYALKEQYDEGFADGVDYSKEENEIAVSEAFDNGFDAGEERGFIEGVASATNYTFASLLDAVFYAPVKMFVSLFNFELLGVNVLGFVTTIITVIIAFGIIKFFL